jgi:hypothetical protein
MFEYETTDKKEAQRFRIAQFNGRMVTFKSGNSTATGRVQSVLQCKPTGWLITIAPTEPGVKFDARRGTRRVFQQEQ